MVTCVWRFSLCRPFCPFSFLVCNQVFFPASTPTRLPRQPGYHATRVYILSRLSRHYPAFTPPRAFTLDHNKVEDSLPRLRIVFVYFSTCGLFRRTNHYPPTGPAPGYTTTQPFHNYEEGTRVFAIVKYCLHFWARGNYHGQKNSKVYPNLGKCA